MITELLKDTGPPLTNLLLTVVKGVASGFSQGE